MDEHPSMHSELGAAGRTPSLDLRTGRPIGNETSYDVIAVLPPEQSWATIRRLDKFHPIGGYDGEVVFLEPPRTGKKARRMGLKRDRYPRLRQVVLGDDPPWWSGLLAAEFDAYLNFAVLHGAAALTLRSVLEGELPGLAMACDEVLMRMDEPGAVRYLPPRERPSAFAVPSGTPGDGHLDSPRDIAVSPDGTRAATTTAGLVKIWDLASGKCSATVSLHADRVRFAPGGGALLATEFGRRGYLLDAATGRQLASVPHEASFSSDGKWLAAIDHEGDISPVWNVDHDAEWDGDHEPGWDGDHEPEWNIDDEFRSDVDHGADLVRVLDATTGAEVQTFPGCWASFGPNNNQVVVEDPTSLADQERGEVGTCTLYTLPGGGVQARVPGRAPTFAPDRPALVTVMGAKALVWDADSGAQISMLQASRPLYTSRDDDSDPVLFSGESVLVRQGWRTVAAWDLATAHHFTIEAVSLDVVSRYGIIVAWTPDGVVGIDARTGHERYRLSGTDPSVDPTGTRVATHGGEATGKTIIASADTGATLVEVPGSLHTFGPRGEVTTALIDGRVAVWDSANGQPVAVLGNIRLLSMARRGESGGMGAGEDLPVPSTVARYVDVVSPETVQVAVPFSLTVQLRRSPADGVAADELGLAPTRDEDDQRTGAEPIYAVVYPSEAFEVAGDRRQAELVVYPDRDAEPVVFKLQARSDAAGANEINIAFFVGAVPLGQVTTVVTVTPEPGSPNLRHVSFRAHRSFENHVSADVILTVNRASAQGLDTLRYRFEWRGNGWPAIDAGQVALSSSAAGLLTDLFATLSDASRHRTRPGAEGDRELRIRKMGENLYLKLFTDELKDLFSQLPAECSLQIYSNEPWIPWELVKPWGVRLPRGTDDYLCARFDMSRWYYSRSGQQPHPQLTVADIAPVIPATNLRAVRDEALYLEQLPARWPPAGLCWPYPICARDVLALMAEGRTNLFHFATHGLLRPRGPGVATIELDRDALRVDEIIGTDIERGLTAATPLVFLNACHSGRQMVSLIGNDGWVQRFLELGCRGFIGANWTINDELAARFALALYEGLIDRQPLARAARRARAVIREIDPGNATWLAYAVYGHPLLTLTAGAGVSVTD